MPTCTRGSWASLSTAGRGCDAAVPVRSSSASCTTALGRRSSGRHDLPPRVQRFGAEMVGHAASAERMHSGDGRLTLVHGDASGRNQRTSPTGEIVFIDWEDVSLGDGIADIAWFLVSSVGPERWQEVLDAHPDTSELRAVLPAAMVQGLFSLNGTEEGSEDADGWIKRLETAASRL